MFFLFGGIFWLILSIAVALSASGKGRSGAGYFFLSLFISPLVAGIILAVQGSASPDSILDNESHIFYCVECNSTYSKDGNKDQFCPECGKLLWETTVLRTDWRSYPDSRKEMLKQEFKNGQLLRRKNASATPVIQNNVSGADEIKKFKELLDLGAITQEEFEQKKKQILGQ
jgi:hypothetical protein